MVSAFNFGNIQSVFESEHFVQQQQHSLLRHRLGMVWPLYSLQTHFIFPPVLKRFEDWSLISMDVISVFTMKVIS